MSATTHLKIKNGIFSTARSTYIHISKILKAKCYFYMLLKKMIHIFSFLQNIISVNSSFFLQCGNKNIIAETFLWGHITHNLFMAHCECSIIKGLKWQTFKNLNTPFAGPLHTPVPPSVPAAWCSCWICYTDSDNISGAQNNINSNEK